MKEAARMSLRMRSHIKSQNYVGPRSFRENENAIYFLGITNATPKKIVEHMKVPGLTREQVASHLQYRLLKKRRGFERGIGNHDYQAEYHGMEDSSLMSMLVRMGIILLPKIEQNDFFYRSQRQENNLVVRTSLSHRADVFFNGISAKRGTFEAASVTYGVTENPSPQAARPSLLGSNNTEDPSVGFIQGCGWTSMLYRVGVIPSFVGGLACFVGSVLYQELDNFQEGNKMMVRNNTSTTSRKGTK